MIRRGEPSHRRYTELCNRSGSPQLLRPAHAQTNNADALEDYWEDASVSLRSYHSWEAPSSAWLNNPTPHLMIVEENEGSKKLCDLGSRTRPRRYSFDASDYLGSVKGRRSFPPPMASCSTMSIKEGGRFVLKEMDADRPQGFFRAQRENGRLLLHLVLPDELDGEDATAAANVHDDVDEEDHGSEDEDNASVVECTEGAGAGICEHVEYDAHDEKFARINLSDCISIKEDVIHSIVLDEPAEKVILHDCDRTCQTSASESEVFYSGRPLGNVLQGVGSKVSACSTSQVTSKEGRSWMHMEDVNFQVGSTLSADDFFLKKSHLDTLTIRKGRDLLDTNHHSSIEENHFLARSSFGEGQGNVLAPHQNESIWRADVASHATASLSPWSSNQLCLHQSLVAMRPAVSLAMT